MPNRRSQIAMDERETRAFLDQAKTAILTTLDGNGWPHSVAMWFLPPVDEARAEVRMWTYAKSQKVKNLERDSRASFLAETGDAYNELRGVLVRARIEVIDDFDSVRAIGKGLHERYVGPLTGAPEETIYLAEIERQAKKRVGLVMPLDRVASWDHRKLGS